jgi:hypothetical protein
MDRTMILPFVRKGTMRGVIKPSQTTTLSNTKEASDGKARS